ncbi:MAG: sigma 54-interacting transcriptional regulator, partial [Peptococcaceae bacterium]|nr:sigma 54-interacting transcriptional regulator [Peptococcaceae bacterium]
MKKKIALVTESIQSGQVYKEWLDEFFGELIEVEEYSLEKGDYVRIPDADLYIVGASSTQAYDQVIALIQPDKNIVVPALTFSKEQVSKLKVLPGGRRAMLVNLSANMAIETIAELNRLGVTQLDLVPVYPGIGQLPDTELAISPGEGRYVPDKAKQVIELGPRTFTSGTLAEIALKLGFSWFIKEKVYRDYVESLADPGGSLVTLWSQSMRMENYLEILMGMMDTGILGVDMEDRIFAVNSVAQDILSLKQKDCIGRSLTWAAPQLCRQISPEERKRKISKLIKLAETPISIATAPIDWEGKPVGCFIMLQRFTEEEDRQQQFRLQLYRRGHHSKYVFDDIICSCPSMQRAKNIAFKMALTDSSILLTGESGTGKELFAHSIHNASRRSAMPFVALNCAALPENLLESELFGYGEGAFTGAKKGGKIGLFEYAHRGTLFLDEIEGMS